MTPSRDYYDAMHGRWRGRLTMKLTDRDALARATLGAIDRLAWRTTLLSERLFGAPWLETRVDASRAGEGLVVHTTLVRQLGMPLVWGREAITLEPEGRAFTLAGTHRFPWRAWIARGVSATGAVDADARGARYAFSYIGAPLEQTTRRDGDDALVVKQVTAFMRAEVRLERR